MSDAQKLLSDLQCSQSSSLELLNPATVELEAPPTSSNHTEVILERRCRRLIQLVADQDWENPDFERLMARNFRAFLPHSDVPHIASRRAYLESYKEFFRDYPKYKCEILDIAVYVDEGTGRAAVWMHFSVHGHPSHLERENITIAYWRKWTRGWVAVKQTGMRGFGGNL